MGFLNTILDMVFPVNCLSCRKAGRELCLSCMAESPSAERECESWIFPLYDYRHKPIKEAVWRMKYKRKKRIAGIFGETLYGRMLEELADLGELENFREPVLVPIPLSRKRMRERGFNQSLLISKKLIELDQGENFKLEEEWLVKKTDTEHQARILNREERLKNILDSFEVRNQEQVKGKNIILIDDVTTTGATLGEARKVLIAAGAKKIFAFTIAH